MTQRRLLAIEQAASGVCTLSELLKIIRIIFKAADSATNQDAAQKFKALVIADLSQRFKIDAGELREVLL